MYKILTLNNISVAGLERFSRDNYEVASEIQHPDAVILRSYKMHDWSIPESLEAVGRAGAGVNNIPVDEMSKRGIPVFNAPGANANAVKELTLAGLFLAARNICQAWGYTEALQGNDEELNKQVEAGKKKYAGFELPHRTLGVVGLGAIGVKVANTAIALGMDVIGYDPQLTVQSAWQLSSDVKRAASVDDLFAHVDFVTFHVPLLAATRGILNATRLQSMRDGVTILNFARGGIVDDEAVLAGIESGKVHAYVTDFPSNLLKNNPKVIALPHLGASTVEAEDNCAMMVVDQVRDYLENGNIHNSVNFPESYMPHSDKYTRLTVANSNVPNMVGQISTDIAKASLNIVDMLNKSRGDLAYTIVDVEGKIPQSVTDEIRAIEGVLHVRVI
ncbi:MAG: phosphoglycerate dehydrogenase [Pseudomonadota bacterium]